MKPQPIKMGINEGVALIFISTFSGVYLSLPAVAVEHFSTIAWLAPVACSFISVLLFQLLFFVLDRVPGDLYAVSVSLLGKGLGTLLILYILFLFYLDAVITLRQFAENTLLTAIPDLDISLSAGWYILMAAIALAIGIQALARAAYLTMPIVIFSILVLLSALYNRFDINNLAPWGGNGLASFTLGNIFFCGINIKLLALVILAASFQDRKTIRTAAWLGLGLTTALRALILFFYLGIFSVAVGREKILPFFEMARIVFINRFVQRVEVIFILIWVTVGMAAIAISLFLSLYLLQQLFHLPSLRPLIFPAAAIGLQLGLTPTDLPTVIHFNTLLMALQTLGVFTVPLLLFAACIFKRKRKKSVCTVP